MTRTLSTYVMVDGVIYAPGTPEKDVKGKVTAEGVWTGAAEDGEDDREPTVKEILDAVGGDKEKAAAALEQEKAGKNRKTLVEPLEAFLKDADQS